MYTTERVNIYDRRSSAYSWQSLLLVVRATDRVMYTTDRVVRTTDRENVYNQQAVHTTDRVNV